MATLHQQYIEFNSKIKLNDPRIASLKTSRKDLRKKIRKWFRENKEDELQPKFGGQGSFEMGTMINPIPVNDKDGNSIIKYDLDDGIYFLEREGEDNRQTIDTWHDWVYSAVHGHTNTPPERHKACIRVIFSDGHHIDLPIYYKKDDLIELAHNETGWTESDPKAFCEWFNNQNSRQLERMVRYFKAWKNFQENENPDLSLPNGVSLTILATNNYVADDNDDAAFRKTVDKILAELQKPDGFKCLRPTTPKDEDLFANFTPTMKDDFLAKLEDLRSTCNNAAEEKNLRTATELLRAEFGNRFPLGADVDEEKKSQQLAAALGSATVRPVPYSK